MDISFQLLLITHLLALGVAATSLIAVPVVMLRMRGAGPDTQKSLGGIAGRLGINARFALGVVIVSGIAMVMVRYGGVEGMNEWFWAKMSLVGVIAVTMIVGLIVPRGAINPAILQWITRLSFLGVVIAAVFAFN